MRRVVVLMAVSAMLTASLSVAHSAPFLYEGFPAGGLTPLPGQYQTEPLSTNGANNNSLLGQGPAAIGFSAGTNWTSADAVAATIYPSALGGGLTYTDMLGNTLVTQAGAADWHRDAGAALNKRVSRNTNLTGPLPNTGYFSALVQFSGGSEGRFELQSHNGTGGLPRELFFGFNAAGNVIAGTSGDTTSVNNVTRTSTQAFAPGETYLLIGEIVNDGVEDNLRLWVNPTDLSNPMSDTPILDSANIGSGWVGDNPSFTFRQLRLFSDTATGSQFIFDELRFGFSIEDVLPFTAATAVPEPATLTIWLIAAGCACWAFRRKARGIARR